jgi:uncharacterized membrane protein YphA (DoxX/SURF4 family)
MTLDPIILWSLRVALALLFAAAAWHKLSDRARFQATLDAYALLPASMLSPASWLLPAFELAIALALLLPVSSRAAALFAAVVLLAYSAAIALNLARGRSQIDCGCFMSSKTTPLSGALLLRNSVLLVGALALLLPAEERPLVWIDALTLNAGVITLSLLSQAMQRLAHTGPALRKLGGAR